MLNRRLLSASLLVVLAGAAGRGAAPAREDSMQTCLGAVAAGERADRFLVRYSDIHGLWGGVAVSVRGDGAYEIERAPRGTASGRSERRLTPEDVRDIARLLVEIEAWEQRVPERAPVPDESRATLVIECGGERSEIWEWYNTLREQQRLVRIREKLLSLGTAESADGPK